MMHWDDSGWPLARVHMTGPQTTADLDAYHTQLGSYLDRGERFAVLATAEPDTSRAEAGAAKRQMVWMTEHAESLRAQLAGMASVVAAEELDRYRSRGAKLSAHLPFPMAVFATEAEAVDWLSQQLATEQPG